MFQLKGLTVILPPHLYNLFSISSIDLQLQQQSCRLSLFLLVLSCRLYLPAVMVSWTTWEHLVTCLTRFLCVKYLLIVLGITSSTCCKEESIGHRKHRLSTVCTSVKASVTSSLSSSLQMNLNFNRWFSGTSLVFYTLVQWELLRVMKLKLGQQFAASEDNRHDKW